MAALGALGDPTRRTIFELLVARPRAVGELADELPVSRPAVSQHLKVLKEAGLVTDLAQGGGVSASSAQLGYPASNVADSRSMIADSPTTPASNSTVRSISMAKPRSTVHRANL